MDHQNPYANIPTVEDEFVMSIWEDISGELLQTYIGLFGTYAECLEKAQDFTTVNVVKTLIKKTKGS